jgi:hypothetical protein
MHVRTAALGSLACLASLGLYAHGLLFPVLLYDDFRLLEQSWTWQAAGDNLWVPANEHTMPLGRLSLAALVQLGGGRPTAMPLATALQGPLALLLGMALVYLFLRRELGHPFYGLAGMIFFGVSTQYRQAVDWFAASFAVLALDTLLLALLAAQSWRRTGRRRALAFSAAGAALAPAWFASGILAGPLCCLYLLPREGRGGSAWRHRAAALVPLLGSLAFLALLACLPRTAARILNAEHYDGRTALEAFNPLLGLAFTARTLADHLAVGTLGVPDVVCPVPVAAAVLVLLATAGAWWWRHADRPRLLLLGLGFILSNYLLIYSFRAGWSYDDPEAGMYLWTRYDLFPHLGLTLFLVGGLPRWDGRLFRLAGGGLTRPQVWALAVLTGLLFLTQLPRGLPDHFPDPEQVKQGQDLARIEAIDARCRALGIDAATARQALPPLVLPYSDGYLTNGWRLLRGSADPRPFSVEQARRLLAE